MADLEEEEVWAMMKPREGSISNNPKTPKNLPTPSPSSAWRFSTTSRSIPRSSAAASHSSAPLNIPDWSKILKNKKNTWDYVYDDDDDDGYEEMVPPHEYLARRLSATQIASFSMCEGNGRTLKGRDLTNLRKAILTKTGFLE